MSVFNINYHLFTTSAQYSGNIKIMAVEDWVGSDKLNVEIKRKRLKRLSVKLKKNTKLKDNTLE